MRIHGENEGDHLTHPQTKYYIGIKYTDTNCIHISMVLIWRLRKYNINNYQASFHEEI